MLIYAEHNTPRLRYVLNFIFRDVFRIEFEITVAKDEFEVYRGPKLNYSDVEFAGSVRVPVSGLLWETGVKDIDPGLNSRETPPALFHTENTRDRTGRSDIPGLSFDLLAAVFYMISRYEEYLPFEADRHGRFEAGSSLAGKNGFLEVPVVDLWILDLGERLRNSFTGMQLPDVDFQFQPTCDIDLPYAFLHRGTIRTLGARVKAGLNAELDPILRREVLSGQSRDPFDTYSEIEAVHALHKIRPKIFFLTSRYGKFDKSISPGRKAFKNLVLQTGKYADLGIHPSYRASDSRAELRKEIRMLSSITGEEISRSRQHFLKFRLPGSYRDYITAGIREDYSMGFASAAGFRAGTSRPFNFYDLDAEEETSLRVVPFEVMDRSLKDYMNLPPEKALEKIMSIAGTIRRTGGIFTTIWHNDAFSEHGEWKGWKEVYLQMINSLAP